MKQPTQKEINEAHAARLIEERRVYRSVLLNEQGRLRGDPLLLLKYLETFCYAKKSTAKISRQTGMIDTHAMAIAEGRREVYNRIQEFLDQSDDVFNKMIERLQTSNEEE